MPRTAAAITRRATPRRIRMGLRGPTETRLVIVPRAMVPRAAITVRSPRIGATLGPLTEATRPRRRTGAIPLLLLRAAMRGGLTRLRHPIVLRAAVVGTRAPTAAAADTPPAEVVDTRAEAEGDNV